MAGKNLVKSPCVSICALDDHDICIGCYRSAQEITRWAAMDDEERLEVIVRAHERSRANNPFA